MPLTYVRTYLGFDVNEETDYLYLDNDFNTLGMYKDLCKDLLKKTPDSAKFVINGWSIKVKAPKKSG